MVPPSSRPSWKPAFSIDVHDLKIIAALIACERMTKTEEGGWINGLKVRLFNHATLWQKTHETISFIQDFPRSSSNQPQKPEKVSYIVWLENYKKTTFLIINRCLLSTSYYINYYYCSIYVYLIVALFANKLQPLRNVVRKLKHCTWEKEVSANSAKRCDETSWRKKNQLDHTNQVTSPRGGVGAIIQTCCLTRKRTLVSCNLGFF